MSYFSISIFTFCYIDFFVKLKFFCRVVWLSSEIVGYNMTGCAAFNCTNRSEKGVRMFRFPSNARRAVWVHNMQRGIHWQPSDASRLCQVHFEESQFEQNRRDGWKKLKSNAIPTLFNVPNPPSVVNPPPRSLYKNLAEKINSTNLQNRKPVVVTKKTTMVQICIVVGCGSRSKRDKVSFFAVPKALNFKHKTHLNKLSELRRKRWLMAIRREDLTELKIKNQRVCSKHFISGAPAKLEEIENPDWVPTQNMGYDKQSRKNVGKKLIKTDSQMDNYVKLLSTPKSHLSEAKENKPQLNLVADFMKATFVSDLNDAGKNGSSLNNTNNIMIVSENPPDWSVKEEPKEIETNDNFLHSEVRDEFPQLMNAGVLKCRTCLSVIDSTSSYILSTVCDPDNFTRTIKDMITSFIPQMADTLPDDDLICSRCLESIKFCVKFITNCLNVEAKLQEVYDIRQLRDEYYGITPAKNNVPDVFQHVTLDHSYITKRKSDNKPAPAECTIDSSGIDAAPPEQENVAGSEQLNLSSVGFVCPKCNKEFQSSGQLDVHLDEVHSKETTVTSPEKKPKLRYGCIYCDKSFTTKFVCKIHLERDHKDKNMGHKTYFCKECMLDCETLSNLLDHNHAKHGFRCTICSKRFSSRASLLTHKEIHPNECFCETCGKAFKSKNDLRIHSYRHKQRITCVCDQCGRTCQSKETLLYHMKTHKTDNLYMCEICSRRFVKRSTLIVHQRLVHEKVRDHECTVCGIKFGMKMTLDKHYAVKHSTLKPHQCEICGLRFGIINYLRKHKLSSHGSSSSTKLGKKANGGNKVYNNTKLSEFKCKFCNLTFESIKSRDNHEKSHENASDEQRYEDCEELNTKENVDEHLPNPNLELDVSQADEEVTSDQDLEDADAV